jgi:DNA-damage-inducible protein D
MNQHLQKRAVATFESLRHSDEASTEYWLARELAPVLEYPQYRNFLAVIDRAQQACAHSGQSVADHFAQIRKLVDIGSGAVRELDDLRLSRYACYLIVQNADPAKPVIAHGQTYFAVQTRRQELADSADLAALSEDERRLAIRAELVEHNKSLSSAAKDAGVETPMDYAIFQDHGYQGLYGGLGAKALHSRKGLKKSQKILDHMGSTELAANLFRATQTEDKLKREDIATRRQANQAHQAVGAKVRKTIEELGGTMPEDLPTPDKSIQQIERANRKSVK